MREVKDKEQQFSVWVNYRCGVDIDLRSLLISTITAVVGSLRADVLT